MQEISHGGQSMIIDGVDYRSSLKRKSSIVISESEDQFASIEKGYGGRNYGKTPDVESRVEEISITCVEGSPLYKYMRKKYNNRDMYVSVEYNSYKIKISTNVASYKWSEDTTSLSGDDASEFNITFTLSNPVVVIK